MLNGNVLPPFHPFSTTQTQKPLAHKPKNTKKRTEPFWKRLKVGNIVSPTEAERQKTETTHAAYA